MIVKKTFENIIFGGITVIAILSVVITAFLVDKSLKENLVIRAQTIASLLETLPTSEFQGNENDLSNPNYLAIKQKLSELHKINKDSRFLYIIKQTDTGTIFLVDSEPVNSADYSPPGQVYEEISPYFQTAIIQGLSGWEISGDRWGRWMTGFAPLYDQQTGRYIALVGIDLDYYTNYLVPIIGYSLIPLFISIIILIILFYWQKFQQIEQDIIAEKDQLIRIAHHEFGTPIAETGSACEKLLENNAVKGDEQALALTHQMYDGLKTLVRRTTNLLKTIELTVPQSIELKDVDLMPLLQEIIASHKRLALAKGKEIHITEQFPDHAYIQGDRATLQIIFENLIAHSLHYTAEHKAVEISYTQNKSMHEITTLSPGDTLTENEAQTLFSAYHKGEPLSSHTESTGLGLYLMHKLIMLHYGGVFATSDNRGVSLVLSFPKTEKLS